MANRLRDGLESILAVGAANAGAVYGLSELANRSDFSEPTNGLMMLMGGAALAGANYFGLLSEKGKGLRRVIGKANSKINLRKKASWAKTLALLGALGFSSHQLKPYAEQIHDDFTRPSVETVSSVNRQRPFVYDELSYTPNVEHDFTGTKLADKGSTIGRIQRTLRWEPIYRAIEKKHGMPKDYLAGMIMQESYGDPVQPNSGNDGGLGITHIQGPTAKRYGMEIFGNSGRSSDKRHGRQIRDMLQDCNYDPACAQEYDERAHLIKVLDTAARIVSEGKEKHGTWDEGVEYYRAPGWVGGATTLRYLRKVKNFRSAIQSRKNRNAAADDFQKRNGYSFSDYIDKWHEMSDNWGLENYKERIN